jgi:hypothetical protein
MATTDEILSITNYDRFGILEIQSTVSMQAAESSWRGSISTFQELRNYVETQYQASNPADYGDFGSEALSRALFYMQWTQGLWAYGSPSGGEGAVMINEVVGTIDPSSRRVLLAITSLVLVAAASPLLALWGVFWSPLVALVGGAWSAFSATLWAWHNPMPCETVEGPSEGKVLSIVKEEADPERRERRG